MFKIKKRKNILICFFSLSLLGIMFLGMCSTAIAADITYNIALTRGTETSEVTQYDKDAWKGTISKSTKPDDWFDGDADEIGAKSKKTVRSVSDIEYETYELWTIMFFSNVPDDILALLHKDSENFDFTDDDINDEYDNKYEAWEALVAKWDFTTDEFDEDADDSKEILPIFKNPEDFRKILEDYNDWTEEMNTLMNSFGLSVPTLSEDEFLWQLVLNGLTIASPIDSYLEELIDELDCDDAKVKDNVLILEREDDDDYIVEITYGDQGTQTSFVIKDEDGKIIYEMLNENSSSLVLIILGVLVIGIAGIVFFAIRKRKKIRKIELIN